jgi:hypothetical protein
MLLREGHQGTHKIGTSLLQPTLATPKGLININLKATLKTATSKAAIKALGCMVIKIACKGLCLHLLPLITTGITCLDMECLHPSMGHQVNQDTQLEDLLPECLDRVLVLATFLHMGPLLLITNRIIGAWACSPLTSNLRTASIRVNT